jgi:hypothetical protein
MAQRKHEPGPPMDLANMRRQGVRNLIAYCLNDACRHQAVIDVSSYPGETLVPWFRSKVKCAKCGARGLPDRLMAATRIPFDMYLRPDPAVHGGSGRLRDVFVWPVHQIGRGVDACCGRPPMTVPIASNRRGVRRERSGPYSWDGCPRATQLSHKAWQFCYVKRCAAELFAGLLPNSYGSMWLRRTTSPPAPPAATGQTLGFTLRPGSRT